MIRCVVLINTADVVSLASFIFRV